MKTNDDGAIGGGGKRAGRLVLVTLLIVLVMVLLAGPAQAGLRERIEYRGDVVDPSPVYPYPLILATYTPGPTATPYPMPDVCWPPFLCLVR